MHETGLMMPQFKDICETPFIMSQCKDKIMHVNCFVGHIARHACVNVCNEFDDVAMQGHMHSWQCVKLVC